MTLRSQVFGGQDANHVATQSLTSASATGKKIASNVGSTDGGNNDLGLAIVIRPK